MTGPEIEQLMKMLARLPGWGPRSARRATLHLLKNRETLMLPLAQSLTRAAMTLRECEVCGNLDTLSPCYVCADSGRDGTVLCIVEDVGDLWALEKAGGVKGYYHILGGTLSALDGVGPDDLALPQLLERLQNSAFKEVIIALNPTVDGQTTAHYIADLLKSYELNLTQLARGVPVGAHLDHLDDGTLATALKARRRV